MRVALSFPGCHRRGGVERVMLECCNFMAQRGHETNAFSHDFDLASLDSRVIKHQVDLVAPIPALAAPAYLRQSREAIFSLSPPPDVVASFGTASPSGSVVWMQSVHAAWMEVSRNTRDLGGRLKQRANPFHPVALSMERRLLRGRRYGAVIALTDEVKRDIERFYDVPGADIKVLPNGYSRSEFRIRSDGTRERVRAELGFGPADRVVVFVANEMERKGFEPLLRAVALIGDSRVRILAVGRLDASTGERLADRYGLGGRVRFSGPTSEVANYYAAADVFALPTKYEAWGLVVVEAMACGLPVLTSRLAGAAITVVEGSNGLLLSSPHDQHEIAAKLRRLLDGEHASREGVAASVAQYEWSTLLEGYERILADVAG